MKALTEWRYTQDVRVRWRLEFKIEDLWVGAFWRIDAYGDAEMWICVLPCLPIHFEIRKRDGGTR